MEKPRLLLLFLTLFFVMLGFGIIIPNLAYYAEDIGATPTEIAVLMSIYSGMQLLFAPLWGRLSDKHGRKPAILFGLFGNAVALVAFGLAKSYVWLFIARGAAGVASAAVLPAVMAYVADVTTEEERGSGMGLMGAAMGLGFILGPALGGIMGRHDLPFFVAGGLSLLTFLFAMFLLPESLSVRKRGFKPRLPGGRDVEARLPEGGDAVRMRGFKPRLPGGRDVEARLSGEHDAEPRLSGERDVEARLSDEHDAEARLSGDGAHHKWVSPREIFRWTTLKSPLNSLFLVAFFTTFSFAGLEATFPLFISEEPWNYGQREMGWMFAIIGVIVVPLQGGLLGRLINRFGERRLILIGMVLNAVGMALLSGPSWFAPTSFLMLASYLTIAGIGNQLIRPTNTSWISKQTHIGQGTAIGIMDAFLSLGRILGPLLGGWLYEQDAYPYPVLAGILLIATVCLYIPLRRIRYDTSK